MVMADTGRLVGPVYDGTDSDMLLMPHLEPFQPIPVCSVIISHLVLEIDSEHIHPGRWA